jgi:hypothetical protein
VCLLAGNIQFMKDLKDVAQQKVLQSADLRIEPRMYPLVDIRAKDLAFLHPYVSKPYTLFPSLSYKNNSHNYLTHDSILC